MKRQRWTTAVLVLLLGIVSIAMSACQDENASDQSAAPQSRDSQMAQQPAEAGKGAASGAASQNMELVGTLARSDDTFIIITDKGDYSISNQPAAQNIDEMVGKQVKVTATLVEGADKQDGTQTIDVIQLTEIE